MSNQNRATYSEQIEAWRKQREADLRAPDSWLSLTGLFILKEGYHTIGSGINSDILLPAQAPADLGVIEFSKGKASLTVTTATPVLVNGVAVQKAPLVDNSNRQRPTLVTVGTVTFFLHHFGDQYAIRVKDSTSPVGQTFTGCEWFPVQEEYRLNGKFVPHAAPQALPIKTIVNTNSTYQSVGTVEFTWQGQPLHLLAQDFGTPGQLFIAFRDATSGKQTYAPTRFLNVELDEANNAIIDFNKAVNPPCAFTPFATCPLPPRENILSIPIEAGELYTPATEAVYHAHEGLKVLA